MLNKISFILFTLAISGTKVLKYSDAKADFSTKILANIKDLTMKSSLNEADKLFFQYYNVDSVTNKAVHAINIGFTDTKSENRATLHLERAARPDLSRPLNSYYENEMDFQWVVLNELVSRMMIAPELGKQDENLYLNLIEDVRLKIKENYKELKLDISFLPNEQKVHLELFSKESLVSTINIGVLSSVPSKSKSAHHAETNYFMDIEMIISKNNLTEVKKVQIDMITEDKNHFKNKINELMNIIELNKYSNNNEDNLKSLADFFTKNKMKADLTSNANLSQNMVFNISFENQKAEGFLDYVKPVNIHDIGSYNLKIMKDGEKLKEISFKRMTLENLDKFFKTNELEKIFKSMYEEIMDMFKTKYAETHTSVFPGYELKDFLKEGFMANTQKGLLSKKASDTLIHFLYEETNGNIILSFNAKNPVFILTEEFPKSNYNKNVVREFIYYILTQHVIMKQPNGATVNII